MRKALFVLLAGALAALCPAAVSTQADLGVPSKNGMVVSSSDLAADIGAAVLSRGGNAVDAAVATAFGMAVTSPSNGNIGGGGFMVVRLPNGTATTIDYREMAPGKSTPTMYLDAKGEIDMSLTQQGYLAPGVPGTVRGLALVHKKFGKLPWKDVVMPAAELAGKGFKLSKGLASGLNSEIIGTDRGPGRMAQFPASVAAYGKPGGGKWTEGETIVLGDLNKTLTAIATDGPDAFYKGWIADRIAEDMAAHGGLITKADLANYVAKERAPVKGTFNGYEIISMPPPSSGGIALIEMLNMLEAGGLTSETRQSVKAIHMVIEAQRRAYLDRARFLGDTDFVDVPVVKLTSKAHAKEMWSTFLPQRASSSAELGKDILSAGKMPADEPMETTHFSVVDKDGMAVSNTFTLEGGYGSHVVIKGTGMILNNEMGDFNKKPGTTNATGTIGTPANIIAPGKRMLSSMTPVIIAKNGKLVMVTGSPGGRTIINTVLHVVLGVTAWNLTGREAVDSPRWDHEWMPDKVTFEGEALAPAAVAELQKMGYEVVLRGEQGSAQTIWMHPQTGTAFGIADLRSPDAKAAKGGS
jgi:gamma-glutamyltranspeptidase/glutathione hydrolase